MDKKFTEKQFHERFPNDDVCLEEIKQLHFGNDITCPKCIRQNQFYRVKGRSAYACAFCGHHIYPLKGTPFAHSSTPLTVWFKAIYLMAQTRSGMSAKTLERMTGVTYKTAWRMMTQIRKLMAEDGMPLFGETEIDETYMHPRADRKKAYNKERKLGWRSENTEIVFGMVERGGRAKVKHVKSAGARVLLPLIEDGIVKGTKIYSDEASVYNTLKKRGYLHETTNHRREEYVRGKVHSQNIENLWSNTKRGIKGVYIHVSPQHLQGYIDEYAFRYSYRKYPKQMFDLILSNVGR